MSNEGIGARVKRREDLRFITGNGQYTDDIKVPNQTYAYILRSMHGHAKILGIKKDEAKEVRGLWRFLAVRIWRG